MNSALNWLWPGMGSSLALVTLSDGAAGQRTQPRCWDTNAQQRPKLLWESTTLSNVVGINSPITSTTAMSTAAPALRGSMLTTAGRPMGTRTSLSSTRWCRRGFPVISQRNGLPVCMDWITHWETAPSPLGGLVGFLFYSPLHGGLQWKSPTPMC